MASKQTAAPQGAANPPAGATPPPATTDHPVDDSLEGGDDSLEGDSQPGGFEDLQLDDLDDEEARPQFARVTDTTAVRGVREHEMSDGKVYRFLPGKETTMPLDVARSVVGVPTFIVKGPNGEIYEPARQEIVKGAAELQLRNDQIIANLDELTVTALRDRQARWIDHPEYEPRASRMEVIDFIMRRLAEAPQPGRQRRSTSRSAAADLAYDRDGMPVGDGEARPLSATALAAALERQRASEREIQGARGYGFRS